MYIDLFIFNFIYFMRNCVCLDFICLNKFWKNVVILYLFFDVINILVVFIGGKVCE